MHISTIYSEHIAIVYLLIINIELYKDGNLHRLLTRLINKNF